MHTLVIVCSTVSLLFLVSNIHGDDKVDTTFIQTVIDRLPVAKIQEIFQSLLGNKGRQDSTHWCCNHNPGVDAITKTRQTTYYVDRHARNKCGYHSCGVFGWSSCTKWCDHTWKEVQHGVETYVVYQDRICPAASLVCCSGYITVLNHCFTYAEVMSNKDVLELLTAMGIPINPTMG